MKVSLLIPLLSLSCINPSLQGADSNPVMVREFKTNEFVWSFGSFKNRAKVEDNALMITAPASRGGAGVVFEGNFAEYGDWIPQLNVTLLSDNQSKGIKMTMKDRRENDREWTFSFDGLSPGQSGWVLANGAQPLDPAAIGEPSAEYDPSGLKALGFIGDWRGAPVALKISGVRLVPVTPEMRADQEKRLADIRRKLERETAKERKREERRNEILTNAPHPEDGPRVVNVGTAGAEWLIVNLHGQTHVPGKQIPTSQLEGFRIEEKPMKGNPLAIENGKLVVANERKVKEGRKTLGNMTGDKQWVTQDLDTTGTPLSLETVSELKAYRITSTNDSRYTAGATPTEIFRKSRPLMGSGRKRPMEHEIYLKLPHPLRPGASYSLEFVGVITREPDVTFVYDSARLRSPAVNVNHLGFRPEDPLKRGFLSLWMGDGGAVSFDQDRFEVLDAGSRKVMFSGDIVKVLDPQETENIHNDNHSKTNVYHLDFSSFSTPGEYVLHVPGVGTSLSFRIAENVYQSPFLNSMHGMLSHRSGIALGAPFTEYERPVPMKPGVNGFMAYQIDRSTLEGESNVIRDRVKALAGQPAKVSNLQPVPEAWGGYMDAGDWDRRSKHFSATEGLLELYDLFPETFRTQRIPLPPEEASNTIPDILDEALWNIDAFERLQLPSGAVRGGIESTAHPRPGETSWQESLVVGVFSEDPVSTYRFASAAANAARHLKAYDPQRASRLKEKALKAWQWADTEGTAVAREILGRMENSKNNTPSSLSEHDRMNAAVSLYALTEDPSYHQVILDEHPVLQDKDPLPFLTSISAYLRLPSSLQDPAAQESFRSHLLTLAETSLKFGDGNAYGITMPVNLPLMGFVAFYSVPETVLGSVLLRAHAVTEDPRYLEGALRAAQFTLGGNPIGMTFTTGLGHKHPRFPLHVDAKATGKRYPRGITVYGNTDMSNRTPSWVNQWFFRDTLYPASTAWPTAEGFQDIYSWPEMNEYTIHQTIGPMCYVLGYFHAHGR